MKAGLKNPADHYDETGKEVEAEVEQRALELKFIREMAGKHGVDENRILALMAGEGEESEPPGRDHRDWDLGTRIVFMTVL